MSTRVADVYKGGVLAGSLKRIDGGTEFSYLDSYAGPAVATTLPRDGAAVVVAGAAVPPYFAGLLPEGRRLTAVRRSIKASADDELSLLAAIGADTVGDVAVVERGSILADAQPIVVVRDDVVDRHFSELTGDSAPVDRIGLPGVQDKVSGRMISYPTRGRGADYILKLNPPEFPHVVENENYFLRLAKTSGLPVVAARLIRDVAGQSGLLVTRFDRLHDGDNVTRVAVEDACQAANAWPGDKYALGAEAASLSLIGNCAAAPVAARDVFRQFVFASLTGNGDLHAKNLAMMRADAEWRVTPAYDLPCTLFYGDDTLAMEIDGSTAPMSRKRARSLAASLGLPARAADRVINDLLEKTATVAADIESGMLPFAEGLNRSVARTLAYRHRQLRE